MLEFFSSAGQLASTLQKTEHFGSCGTERFNNQVISNNVAENVAPSVANNVSNAVNNAVEVNVNEATANAVQAVLDTLANSNALNTNANSPEVNNNVSQ